MGSLDTFSNSRNMTMKTMGFYQHKINRDAKALRDQYPDLSLCQRRLKAAELLGFKSIRHFERLLKLLGEDGRPSRMNITLAGGCSSDALSRPIDSSTSVVWSEAKPL